MCCHWNITRSESNAVRTFVLKINVVTPVKRVDCVPLVFHVVIAVFFFSFKRLGICTVHLNATSGIIATPNYPSKYPIYMDCLWTIALHPALQITLEFNDFALELEDGCRFDYAEILAGLSTDSPVVARYCGFAAPQTYTRQGNVSIRFVSDSDTELTGFLCTYSVIKGRRNAQ